MSVREVTPGNIRKEIFSNQLEGVGDVPICKNCKHRIHGNRCNRHRDIITGEPYLCEVCRELKDEHICGTVGKFYEEKLKKKRRLSVSFILTTLNIVLVVGSFLIGLFWVSVIIFGLLLLELCGLTTFVDHILNRDEESKGK